MEQIHTEDLIHDTIFQLLHGCEYYQASDGPSKVVSGEWAGDEITITIRGLSYLKTFYRDEKRFQ